MAVSSVRDRGVDRPPSKPAGRRSARAAAVLVALLALIVAAGLVVLASRGPVFAIVACSVAVLPLTVLALGRERMAVGALMGALAVAPMYLGISPVDETSVTPPDVFLLMGGLLLLPTLIGRPLQLPPLFGAGLGIMTICGIVAAVVSTSAILSAIGLVQWLITMAAFAVLLALWRPSPPVVATLAWSYVAGHVVSAVGGVAVGHQAAGRWYGLTHHPNAFGEAGMMSVALLLFLFHYHRSAKARAIVLAAGAMSVASVVASGGRAATVVVAVLILLIPVVERSAISGFVMAVLGGVGIVMLPLVVGFTGDSSALARLTNVADVSGADLARGEVQTRALDKFAERPWTGSGTINFELFTFHDTVLQVAVGLGVFGVVGFALVLLPLAKPLFFRGPYRRLSYTAWGFIGFCWTTPGMQDRSLWVPMSLAILAALATEGRGADDTALDEPTGAVTDAGRLQEA